ncbi:MAG TPA: LysR substrate-binding domain-containing protein [Stellaceae bacterium]|nr:LysR substrate-binding domain-containing protein [Stellaceae bacterium]
MPETIIRMPSLDLVRGFVAVGRRMSITLAAQDLCLTQSAVSRQVHTLEDALGVKLLIRGYRSISFTAQGEHLFRIADSAMQQLQGAVSALTSARERVPVTITASIGVSALWLLPRLGGFQQRYPHIDVRVAAINKAIDLRTQGADLGIRYCAAASAPPGSVRLFGESVVPVAHASLGVHRLDAAVVAENVLIEFDDPQRPWLQWADRLTAMGLGAVKPKGILRFNQYDQVILAAVAGQGIALGRLALVGPMLQDKRLLALGAGAQDQASDHAYWLIQAETAPREDVRSVIDWIKAEARAVDVPPEAEVKRALSGPAFA